MKHLALPRLALLASAAALGLAACTSSSDGPVTPAAVPGLRMDPGVFTAASVQVCVDPLSPGALYTFTSLGTSNLQSGDVVTSPLNIDTSIPGPICGNILARVPAGTNPAVALITVHAATAAAGTFSFVCANDIGGSSCNPPTGTNDATAGESSEWPAKVCRTAVAISVGSTSFKR